MNIKEIVEAYLKENRFDGLYSGFYNCECQLGDLFPCNFEGAENCVLGYCQNHTVKQTQDKDFDFDCEGGDHCQCIGAQKPEKES